MAWYKSSLLQWADEAASFGDFRSAFMGLVNSDGNVDHYDGFLRVMDADGNLLADRIDPTTYTEYLGEAVEPWTYLKSTYWKALGYPHGIYRVGPLARVIVADHMGTLRGPDILLPRVRAFAGINNNEGIGVSEAPRGTLLHHYRVDAHGIVEWANLVIATGHNNLAMNRGVLQVAKRYVKSAQLTEPMLNRVEAVIRCFDPCLSCSTHALGAMELHLQLIGPSGAVLDELVR